MAPLEPPDTWYLSGALGWLGLRNAAEAEAELAQIRSSQSQHSLSTRSGTSRQMNLRPTLRSSAPGSRCASVSIWKPLQMPMTGPPFSAKRLTSAITGLKRATAPQRM